MGQRLWASTHRGSSRGEAPFCWFWHAAGMEPARAMSGHRQRRELHGAGAVEVAEVVEVVELIEVVEAVEVVELIELVELQSCI